MPTAAELITKIEVQGVDKYSRDMRKVEQDTDNAATRMDSAGKKAGGFSSSLASIGGAAALGGIAAVGVGLAGAVKTAADFSQALANVSAATGATSEQMSLMRAEALKIGADTSKSASEAVAAMGELTKSGVSVQDAVGGVARTVVQMSEASGSSVAKMATLMSDSLNVFGLGADQAGSAANTLVKAAGASSISIEDLAQSLSAGGLVAKNAGLSIDQFSTAIGILGNQGLKSSDAGTSLKAMIAGLTPVTDKAAGTMANLGIEVFDAQGNFKAFPDILAELSEGFAGLTQEQRANAAETLFGSDGIRAFNALVPDTSAGLKDATTQFADFTAAMSGAPSIAEQSAARLNTLGGQIEKLKGSLETIAIEVGSVLLPALTQAAAFLADNIGPAFETLKANADTILPVLGAIAAGLGAMAIAGSVAAAVTTLSTAFAAFSALAANIGPIAAVVAILGGPLTLAIVGIGAAIAVLVLAWTQNWGDIQGKTEAVVNAIRPILDALGARLSEFGQTILPELAAAWESVSGKVQAAAQAIQPIVEGVFGAIQGFLQAHSTEIQAILQGTWDAIVVIVNTVTGVISNSIQFWLNVLQGDWSGAWTNIKNTVQIIWDGIRDLSSIFLTQVFPALLTLGLDAIKSLWNAAWNEIKASVDNAINGENGVLALVKAMPGAILAALSGIGTLLYDTGKDLIQGMINGAQELGDTLISTVRGFVQGAIDAAWDAIKPGSPSREGHAMMVNLFEGMISGASDMGGALKDKMVSLAKDALEALKSTVTGALGGIGGAISGAAGAVGGALGGVLPGGGSGSPDQVPIERSANGIGYAPGAVTLSEGQVRDLVNQAMAITGIQMSPSEYEGYINRLRNESSFNTGIVNMNDVNWRNGTPSIGIAQTIGPTFRQNALPGYGDILNPLHNIIASLRYIRARYPGGAPPPLPGVPYAQGGTVKPGWFTVGERGFELGYLDPRGRLTILPNDLSKKLIGPGTGTLAGYAGGSGGYSGGRGTYGPQRGDNLLAEKYAAYVAGDRSAEINAAYFQGQQMIADYMTEQAQYWAEFSEQRLMEILRQARSLSAETRDAANELITDYYAGVLTGEEAVGELLALIGRGRGRRGRGGGSSGAYAGLPDVMGTGETGLNRSASTVTVYLNVDGRQFAQAVTPLVSEQMAATTQTTMGGY